MTFELTNKDVESFLRSKTEMLLPNAMFFPISAGEMPNSRNSYYLDLSFHFTIGTEKLLVEDWKPVVLRNTKDFLAKVRDQLDLAIKDLEETP